MRTIQIHSHVGPDGMLDIRVPAGVTDTDLDVLLVLNPLKTNGHTSHPAPAKDSWQEFVRRTAGSIPDFPDVERPGPESYEERDSF